MDPEPPTEGEGRDVFHYVTPMNEHDAQPCLLQGARADLLRAFCRIARYGDDGPYGQPRSRARRRPLNCQRASAGKKLR
jgi:hypothetical protein